MWEDEKKKTDTSEIWMAHPSEYLLWVQPIFEFTYRRSPIEGIGQQRWHVGFTGGRSGDDPASQFLIKADTMPPCKASAD